MTANHDTPESLTPAPAGDCPAIAGGTTPPELELVRNWEILAALLRVRASDDGRGLTRGEKETMAAGEALCAEVRATSEFVL